MAKGKYQEWLEPEGLLKIEGWARDGLTDEQIAHNMGISRETLNQWKKQFSDISGTLKKGKEVVDYMVENALLKSAIGGNVTAQIFWLKNRKPDKWRDRRNADELEDASTVDDGFMEALNATARDDWNEEED